jgi:hypothetical protein
MLVVGMRVGRWEVIMGVTMGVEVPVVAVEAAAGAAAAAVGVAVVEVVAAGARRWNTIFSWPVASRDSSLNDSSVVQHGLVRGSVNERVRSSSLSQDDGRYEMGW